MGIMEKIERRFKRKLDHGPYQFGLINNPHMKFK